MKFRKAHSHDWVRHIIEEKPYLINKAREWAQDVQWGESEEDPDNSFIWEMPAERVLRAVDRHFDGGLEEFVKIMSMPSNI